ncbi:hypothetical protein L2K70_05670 [Nocardioides KLBMP 9356]|uniref:Transmembrane protein n=1 Tax=Nocardioides potassii TaxID=2911371 RepID=A0ABS9H9T0_9ACTN|nr:hypothetical protein [Nocardioides potassii]MCF6377083.1 hypothetical protein [Nocardioides potassii]
MSQPASYDDLPPQTSTVERVVTVLLMLGLAVLLLIASFLGLFFAMASDGCVGDVRCNGAQIGAGIVVASGSPWVVYVVALVVVVVRWVRRKRTWWVPLAALVVGALLWVVGGLIAASAVG